MICECAVFSSGKKKSVLDRDITADVPLVSCSSRSPLEAAAFPPFAFFVWSFFFLHDVCFCARGDGFLLFIFFFNQYHDTTFFLRMMQKKKSCVVLSRIVAFPLLAQSKTKRGAWEYSKASFALGYRSFHFRPSSSIVVVQRGEIGLSRVRNESE